LLHYFMGVPYIWYIWSQTHRGCPRHTVPDTVPVSRCPGVPVSRYVRGRYVRGRYVRRQQINQIRRSFSTTQTPDSVITLRPPQIAKSMSIVFIVYLRYNFSSFVSLLVNGLSLLGSSILVHCDAVSVKNKINIRGICFIRREKMYE